MRWSPFYIERLRIHESFASTRLIEGQFFDSKLYGRVLIKRFRAGTECAIGEEQCGSWQGRGFMDQLFTVRQTVGPWCEQYLANGKHVFWAFMDLEKAYETIDRHDMWQMLECMELDENC